MLGNVGQLRQEFGGIVVGGIEAVCDPDGADFELRKIVVVRGEAKPDI